MNNRLKEVQECWNKGILLPYIKANPNHDLSKPFYFGVSAEYEKASRKIMIIGQETSWYPAYNEKIENERTTQKWSIDYFNCQMGINNPEKDRKIVFNSSAFWKLFREIRKTGFYPCWNNVDKIQRVSNKKIKIEQEKIFSGKINLDNSLLKEEVNISKPDIVLFVTGPYYTFTMAESLEIDEKLLKKEKPVWQIKENGIKEPLKDITSIAGLDEKITVLWSYHPSYIKRSKSEELFFEFIKNAIPQ